MAPSNATKACIVAFFVHWYPYTILPDSGDKTTFTGVNYEILKTTAQKYNMCYKTKQIPGMGGFGIRQANGSFNGAIGVLQRKEADVFMTPVSISHDRYQAVDFGDIISVDYHSILYPYPTFEPDLGSFLNPFSAQTWIAILLSLPTVTIVLWALFKVVLLIHPRNYKEQNLRNNTLYKATLWVFPELISQPNELRAKLTPIRLALTGWLLMTVIISSAYKSNLVAYLSTPKVEVPFETLEDTVKVPGLRVYVNMFSLFQEMYMKAEKGSVLNAFSKIAIPKDFSLTQTFLPYFSQVTKGVFPRLGGESGNLGYVNTGFSKYGHCTLTIAKEKFIPLFLAMVFPKGSEVKVNFNYICVRCNLCNSRIPKAISLLVENNHSQHNNQITGFYSLVLFLEIYRISLESLAFVIIPVGMNEAGILDHLFKSYLTNSTFCEVRKGQRDTSAILRPLRLTDFYGVFSILLGGLALSMGFFVFELAAAKGINKSNLKHARNKDANFGF